MCIIAYHNFFVIYIYIKTSMCMRQLCQYYRYIDYSL